MKFLKAIFGRTRRILAAIYWRTRLIIVMVQLFIGRQVLRGTEVAIVNRRDWVNILNIKGELTKLMATSGTAPVSKKYAKRTHRMRAVQRALVASTKRFVLP